MAMQVEMEDVDRLSYLPDSILSHILSFLSTKEAVGISILSSKWRHHFTLVPNLDFDLEDEKLKGDNVGVDNSFISFVDKMLFFHNTTNIEKFCLKSQTKVDSNCVHRWISAVARRGVKHLDLSIWLDKSTTFPWVVFTCRTLVTLKLDECSFVFDVPKSVLLPNLKTLHLRRVKFLNDDSFKNLLSGCISLEDMVLQDRDFRHINFSISHHLLKRLTICSYDLYYCTFMIDTPNLVYFKCLCPLVIRFSLENMQSLVEADINMYQYGAFRAYAIPVFTGISNVHSLCLSARSLKVCFNISLILFLLSKLTSLMIKKIVHTISCFLQWWVMTRFFIGFTIYWTDSAIFLTIIASVKLLPFFANLAVLELRHCPAHIEWSISTNKGLETLLTSLPELEKLSFYQEFLSSLPVKVPPCLLFKLKVMEISGFTDEENCMEKAKYILKNGGALENLTIRTSASISEAERMKISQVLLGSPRKEKQCRVLVVCQPSCGCETGDDIDEVLLLAMWR